MEKYTEKERKRFIESMKTSGLSIRTFCEKHKINVHTFRYWINRKLQKSTGNDFLQVPTNLYGSQIPSGAEYTISVGNLKVCIPANTSMNEIESLIKMVWKISC